MSLRILQAVIVMVPALMVGFVLAPGAPSNAAAQGQLISDGVPAHTPAADPALLAEARRLQQLGGSQERSGHLDEAASTQQEALALLRDAMGADHPLVQAQSERVQVLHQQLRAHGGGAGLR